MKKCNKCLIEKELIEFYKDKSKKDGLKTICKECQKNYINLNKEYILERGKKYYQNNKEKILEDLENILIRKVQTNWTF
jgi:superfamily II helicase